METDVLIVGAGPTGLSLACQLTRYGIDFVILDKKETTTPYSRAIGVQARTLEIYEQIGLADALIEEGWRADKARLFEGGEVRGEIDLSDIGEGMSAYPFLLIVEQGKHERILHDFLRSSGKDVLWQSELESFSQDASGITARIKAAAGETQTIKAKYLVGCDGAKSPVRNALGLTFEGSTFERLFYVADVVIDWQYSHDALQVCLAQNTITAFFPMRGDDHYRIVGTFPEGHQKDEGDILYEEIERQIIEDTGLKLDITKVYWFSVYKVHSRRVNKFGEGRCFVAGDAAHIHTPAGAQGMNTGIQDGYNLAWKLALVLKGKTDAALLETYNEERLANAERLLETTDRIFDFGASEDWFIAFFRTRIFPHIANFALHFDMVKKLIFPLISQIGINYRRSSLSFHGDDKIFSVKAGDRMPFFFIEGKNVYKRLHEPKFHLLAFSDNEEESEFLKRQLEDKYGDSVDFHRLPLSAEVIEIFGTNEPFIVLLRPDNYIAAIYASGGINEVENYFERLQE